MVTILPLTGIFSYRVHEPCIPICVLIGSVFGRSSLPNSLTLLSRSWGFIMISWQLVMATELTSRALSSLMEPARITDARRAAYAA